MILSKRTFLTVLPVLVLGLSAFAANDPTATVVKSDGSIGQYKLLPVHYDPTHASVVNARLSLTLRDSSLPASYAIPTTSLPVIRDQGQRGTCAYFATVGILETYYMAQSSQNSTLTLSEECLVDVRNWEFDTSTYTGADKPAQRPDPNGDLPVSIIQTVTANGVPAAGQYTAASGTAVDCTYNGLNTTGNDVSMTDYTSIMTDAKPAPSMAYGKGLTFDQNTAPTVDTIRALIAANIPVEVGIVVYNEYMTEVDWRYDASKDTADQIAGGHAIQLVGYNTDSSGKTIFTFKNSWGTTWGNSGFGTMDDGLLKNSWGYDPSFDFITSVHY